MRNLFTYFRGLIPLIALLFMLPAMMWGADVTATLTGSAMLEGNTPSTSYEDHTTGITDDQSNTYTGRWVYQKNGTSYMNMIQLKKRESSNSTRIALPTFPGNIKSIKLTVSSTSGTTSSAGGCTASFNLGSNYNSGNYSTGSIWSQAKSTSGISSVSIDLSGKSTNGSGLYLTIGDSGARIWSIIVVYSGGATDTRTAVNITDFSAVNTTLNLPNGSTTTSVTNDQTGWTPSYTYRSSKEAVARVDANGVITAVSEGEADITVELNIANDDANWKKGSTASKKVTITVTDPNSLKAEKTTFGSGETSGTLKKKSSSEDSEITYSSNKGDGTNPPSITSSKLRIYKPASGNSTGGYLELEANDDYVITGFTLSLGKAGSLQSSIDGGELTTKESSTNATWTYTMSALSAHNVKVYNVGSDSEDIASILVTYAEEEITSYRATYQAGYGADADVVNVDIADCPTYTLKAAPTSPSTYLQFVGWNDGETTYSAGATYPLTKHVTFNAVWEFTNQATAYTKATAATMIIGGTYVWQAQKSDNTNYVATAMGKNTYLGATVLGTYSSLSSNTLTLTSETPQSFIFSLAEAGWLIEDAANTGNYLREIGENKLEWNEEKSVWTMNGEGSDVPSFTNNFDGTEYTMYANLGSTRFNAYTSKGTNADAVLYHLASESAYTLSLVIDGETTNSYTVKDGYSWTLPTPKKYGYIFQGWATEAEGAVVYSDGASYAMPAEAKSLYAVWEAQTIAPSFTTDLNDAEPYQHMKGDKSVVTLTIAANHADTYQWYEAVSATSYEGATLITGAEEDSYTCSNTEIGIKYFFCTVTNTVGSVNSKIATVNTVGSSLCKLSHVEFSNGFDAFIKDNKITAYYMAGTTAPTIVESSIKVSDNATKVIEGSTLTVTAEDGTTQAAYSIDLSEVTPLTASTDGEATFDGNEDWIKTGYGWDATKGWMFSRNLSGDDDSRMVDGRNRLYFFVGPAKTLVLNNIGVTNDRAIKVCVNGVEQTSVTQINKNSASTHTITIPGLKDNDNNMIAIVSNQNSGDGGFMKYTYTANPQHHIIYKVNGAAAKEEDVYEGYALTFPADPADIEGKKFQGWIEGDAIVGVQETAPSFVNTTNLKATKTTTYHAVFAEEVETTFDASDITNTPAVTGESLSWADPNTGVKLHLSAGSRFTSGTPNTFSVSNGTTNYFQITSNANITKIVTTVTTTDYKISSVSTGASLSTSSTTQTITATSSSLKDVKAYATSNKQIRATEIKVYSITDYCTTPLPQVSMTVSATELADYVDNTNSTLTISGMQGDYEGTVTVASNKDEVATAELDGNTIKIKGISAGKARITVTAPATAQYSKKIAYIDVTISEKEAHGLSFRAATLSLIVGATEIVEPKLSNPNSLPVVYSLVYATPANEGKVATIDPATGKITLAGLSTETQGAVTVKASTVGDNSHAAGEVTYNLVVTRKVTTTSWSNGGAAVSIDQDDMDELPSASNDGGLAITYTSSNENAAKFVDGVLTFVGYGTTTITAATEANEEYAATLASYVLTFAPRYTVTFKVFDQDDVVLREETSGAGVTAPAVSSMGSKVFRGWAEEEIDGTTDIAPTFVTTANLDGNKILYAVFATGSNGASTEAEGSANFSSSVPTGWTTSGTTTYFSKPVGMKAANAYVMNKNISDFKNYASLASLITIGVTSLQNGGTGSKLTVYLVDEDGNTIGSGKEITPVNASDASKVTRLTVSFDATAATGYMIKCTTYDKSILITATDYTIVYTPTVYSAYCTSFTSESITLTDPTEGYYGFSTFCGSANYTVEGAKAYKAKVENGNLVLTELTGIIPAGNSDYENGVVIAGTPGETATIHYTSEVATADMSGNQLLGTLAVTPAADLKGNATYLMVFSKSNGGFVSYTGVYVPAYKACLPYSDNAGAPMRMVFGRDNLPTNNVNVNVNDNLGTKVMIDGRLYILRDGKTYDSLGRLVK